MFQPDTDSRFTGEGKVLTVPAESITQAGGVIVVTQVTLNGGTMHYGLSHRTTGATLTGPKGHSANIRELKRRARAAWRLLSKEQRHIWKTSIDLEELRCSTPREAVRVLRGK